MLCEPSSPCKLRQYLRSTSNLDIFRCGRREGTPSTPLESPCSALLDPGVQNLLYLISPPPRPPRADNSPETPTLATF